MNTVGIRHQGSTLFTEIERTFELAKGDQHIRFSQGMACIRTPDSVRPRSTFLRVSGTSTAWNGAPTKAHGLFSKHCNKNEPLPSKEKLTTELSKLDREPKAARASRPAASKVSPSANAAQSETGQTKKVTDREKALETLGLDPKKTYTPEQLILSYRERIRPIVAASLANRSGPLVSDILLAQKHPFVDAAAPLVIAQPTLIRSASSSV